jgi:hypothetical protein
MAYIEAAIIEASMNAAIFPEPILPEPIAVGEDRSIAVPPGHVVKTGYVSVWRVRLGCRERMAIGDVNQAYQRRLQLAGRQPWPCPRGYWDGEEFVIEDGRHEYVAAVMLGYDHLLVAWLAPDEAAAPRLACVTQEEAA